MSRRCSICTASTENMLTNEADSFKKFSCHSCTPWPFIMLYSLKAWTWALILTLFRGFKTFYPLLLFCMSFQSVLRSSQHPHIPSTSLVPNIHDIIYEQPFKPTIIGFLWIIKQNKNEYSARHLYLL